MLLVVMLDGICFDSSMPDVICLIIPFGMVFVVCDDIDAGCYVVCDKSNRCEMVFFVCDESTLNGKCCSCQLCWMVFIVTNRCGMVFVVKNRCWNAGWYLLCVYMDAELYLLL